MFKRDHTKLICDVGEITDLFHDAVSMEEFLQKITAMVTRHMDCEVCSIYLYDANHRELVLKATTGLNPGSVNKVRMKIGEGLTGLALKERRPICEGQAKNNPNFRFFSGIGEEKFESFLAVPILRGNVEVGVMVIQSEKKDYFASEDIQVFRAITAQLATTIETARVLIMLNDKKEKAPAVLPKDLKFIRGRCGAEGVALATTAVIGESATDLLHYGTGDKRYSEADLHRAITATERQLEKLQIKLEETLPDMTGLIFNAQVLMLKDKGFMDSIFHLVKAGINPPSAVAEVVNDYVSKFSRIEDSYLREKIYDVKDVGRRLLENLTGREQKHGDYQDKIVIASELFPSDALKLFSQRTKGIILLSGGAASHVAILARSLNIPLVVVHEGALLSLAPSVEVLLDASMGYVYIDPDPLIKAKVLQREELDLNIDSLKKMIRERPQTRDGVVVKLMANINLLGDLKAANEFKADGVGLYRSEFPFMIRNNFPSEQEQYLIYRRLVEGMPGKEITLRTLDIGGDKVLSYTQHSREGNPFLGMRSIRLSLKHPDVFIAQLRAMLLAGAGRRVRILFPMISSLDEFLQAKAMVQECVQQLETEGKEFAVNPPLGVMVELPSTVEIINDMAQEADFLSIGTNDLVQYMLAVDRTNDQVAALYLPHHPAVLRALKKVVEAGLKYGREVSICGDMANDPKYLGLLLGLGLRCFSMDARYLPRMHEQLRQLSVKECEKLTQKILAQSQISRIAQLLESGGGV
ncbi:MAG: phosphoenolpyruvate--protein phosphotransferase [Candidatus Omnitrophica bacterium]|nr:phosphoenolpyruvate--protein phosphotransferase [Candidatus Omnitrophota bacterium]MDE2223198.1 phosphoenolpyruvate--protein phosphotransferase [Candidatus Omnitrophota bacterium]